MIDLNKIVIIIPALNPNEKVISLVKDLKKEDLVNIVETIKIKGEIKNERIITMV